MNQSHQHTSDIWELKKCDEKSSGRNRNYAKPPHNHAKYNLNSHNSPCGTPTA
jgi:hypothetical protein